MGWERWGRKGGAGRYWGLWEHLGRINHSWAFPWRDRGWGLGWDLGLGLDDLGMDLVGGAGIWGLRWDLGLGLNDLGMDLVVWADLG